ncbi:MAG: type II toxin-antitoxin system HicB family antitoxin [Thermomicrobiales bacterium]|nr:type II toxin-antitoxin system HicB family antitoxin [Thermomicrobiales bacterium]
MSRHYTVLLEWDPEGPGYAVSVPALPGCFTQGATVPEALDRAREAISSHIAALVQIGDTVPVEDSPALLTVVEVDDIALAGD